jgi:hypothetical protein
MPWYVRIRRQTAQGKTDSARGAAEACFAGYCPIGCYFARRYCRHDLPYPLVHVMTGILHRHVSFIRTDSL